MADVFIGGGAADPEVLAWTDGQPWAQRMAICRQEAQWHAEGNVWTHTRMVCAELLRLAEWPLKQATWLNRIPN